MNDRWKDRFDQELRSWARRPSETSPERAAARVVERLSQRRTRFRSGGLSPLWVSAAAALAVVIGLSWRAMQPIAVGPDASPAELDLPPLEDHVLLLWLDEDTPLYLNIAPPANKGGFSK